MIEIDTQQFHMREATPEMPLKNKLLQNIFYGSELEKLENFGSVGRYLGLSAEQQDENLAFVRKFFQKSLKGVFGGPITAGDALFIIQFLAAARPNRMIEVGVCSGFSSAFLLQAGAHLGLARGDTFLHSYDLLSRHGEKQLEVGRVIKMNDLPEQKLWQLTTGMTLPQLAELTAAERPAFDMAFIDANHQHPWPLLDILSADRLLAPGNWILMQDVQVMERWLANSVEFGAPCPRPCRGVTHVAAHWPLEKHYGTGPCYNMVALKSGLTRKQAIALKNVVLGYPSEIGSQQTVDVAQKIEHHLSKL